MHRIEAQLARCLLTTADRLRSHVLPLTHEHLSDMLGTTRPSVTLAAQALEDTGAIRRSYGRIEVVDVDRLWLAACECYDTIRDERDRLLRGL
jgi:CRP-like cAMP-binding protein